MALVKDPSTGAFLDVSTGTNIPALLADRASTRRTRIAGDSALSLQELKGQQASQLASEDFSRKSGFAAPYLEQLSNLGTGADLAAAGEPSEAEQILIQSQEEASERDVNLLQDSLSAAGIFSSGTLATGTGQILGQARGQIASGLAASAESRLTRQHEELLAKRQQLTELVKSILL